MPLPDRVLQSPFGLNPINQKEISEYRADYVQEYLNVFQLKGVLIQFAQISNYAHEVFSGIHQSASQTFTRIKRVSQRAAQLKNEVDQMKEEELAAKVFAKNENTETQMDASMFIFQRTSLPKSIGNFYEGASKLPNVAAFDPFTEPPTKCQEKYSNPNFFMEKWIEAETKRQEEVAEKKRKRREARKAKKKKKENAEEKDGKKRIEVATVKKKKYGAMGAEFASEDAPEAPVASPAGRPASGTTAAFSTVDPDEVKETTPGGGIPPPSPLGGTIPAPSPMQPKMSIAAPTLTVPGVPAFPAAVMANRMSTIAAPPPITQMVAAGPPPPPIPPPPVAPPPPRAPAPGAPAIGGGGLLTSISQGVELKKVERVQAGPTLMEQIRSGAALKKVVVEERKVKEEEGTMGEIKKLLDRRKFIEEEEESDEEWE